MGIELLEIDNQIQCHVMLFAQPSLYVTTMHFADAGRQRPEPIRKVTCMKRATLGLNYRHLEILKFIRIFSVDDHNPGFIDCRAERMMASAKYTWRMRNQSEAILALSKDGLQNIENHADAFGRYADAFGRYIVGSGDNRSTDKQRAATRCVAGTTGIL
jgi:hypothetical protein